MGTLLHQDLLAAYEKLKSKFETACEYALTDAEALPKLSIVLYDAQALRKEMENNVSQMAMYGNFMFPFETAKLRADVEALIRNINNTRAMRASIIRENLHDAGL